MWRKRIQDYLAGGLAGLDLSIYRPARQIPAPPTIGA